MGLELAKAYIRVQADASGVGQDFGMIRQQANQHFAGIRRAALGILGIFTGGMAGILRSGLANAAQFEQTTIAFETMLGSAKETQKTLNDLTMFAAKTPFEMPEVTQAARGLIQFGERGKELMETLNLLGNAASGSSTPFGFVALVYNQIRGVGKLITQDFRQLSTRGILSMKDIADYFGVSLSEAEKKISSGAVKFEDVRKIFKKLSGEGGRFFNLMEKQSQSLSGLGSTLRDAWNIMFRILAQALMPMAKGFVAVTIRMVETIQAVVEKTGGLAGAALAGATAFATLGTAILGAAAAMMIFNITFPELLIGVAIASALVAVGAAVGVLVAKFEVFQKATPYVTDAFNVVQKAILDLWDWASIIIENWEHIWKRFPDVVRFAMSYIGDIIGNAGPLMAQSLGYALSKMLDLMLVWANTLIQVVAKLMAGITDLIRAGLFGGGTKEIAEGIAKAIVQAGAAFNKGIAGVKPDWSKLWEMSPRTKDFMKEHPDLQKLWDMMLADKQLREMERNKKGEEGKKPPPESPAGSLLKAGRYGIPEFGTKIQDKLLEGKNDQLAAQNKTNSLLEEANRKQDELIGAVNGQAGQPAVLGAGDE